MSEYEGAPTEADNAGAQLQHQSGYEFFSHRKWRKLDGQAGETLAGKQIEPALIDRVIQAYKGANAVDHNGRSMWTEYFNQKHPVAHNALLTADVETVKALWENPASNYCFWGFDELHPDYTSVRHGSSVGMEFAAQRVFDNLLQLATALGVVRMDYPEAPTPRTVAGVENILQQLDECIGFRIDFPNPYPYEYGLTTSRGVASYRAIQAVYQAFETLKMVRGIANPKIVEIGPGLGRAAYYCYKAGIKDYTLIDLPFSNVSQAVFLGTVLRGDAISLYGENQSAPLRISTPDAFLESFAKYDLAVNFDSLTEMDETVQRQYIAKIGQSCGALLSVNHEYNPGRVFTLLNEYFPERRKTRDPYWMRRGYVQEKINFNT